MTETPRPDPPSPAQETTVSKIDDYKKKKAHADTLEKFLASSRGANSCDKFGARVKVTDTYRGYYGHSGCSSWPDAVVTAVELAIRENWPMLLDAAWKRATQEAEAARRAAEAEAREVLGETTTP